MKNKTSLGALHDQASGKLLEAGFSEARKEARLLMQIGLGLSNSDFFARSDEMLDEHQIASVEQLVQRRLAGEPVARLRGKASFFEHEFHLNAHTLVPRPETEHVVEQVLAYVSEAGLKAPKIVDLGTGSGCIILSLLRALKASTGVGVDVAPGALEMARKNADALSVSHRVDWIEMDMRDAEILNVLEGADILVSNPPYIRQDEIKGLDRGVKEFDPILALQAANDGLEFYQAIAAHMQKLKRPLFVALEVGQGQADDVAEMLRTAGCAKIKKMKDLAGIDRVVEGHYVGND